MADEQVRLDELPQRQYEAAREDGATETVAKSEVEEVPKVTGEERQMKTYNEKRDAQESRGKGGFQKRIDGLIREREQERERREAVERRLQEIEGRNGNSNGEDLQRQESESHSSQPEQRSEPAEPKIAALRERYSDFDQVMEHAQKEHIRISDEAADVMHSLENGGDIAYHIVSNPKLRNGDQ